MKQNKMSSAKQTNKQVWAEASLLNKMEKKPKGMKETWKRKNGKVKNAMSL